MTKRKKKPPESPPERPTILVVEDDESQREILTLVLQNHDFDVVTAVNGEDALEKLSLLIPAAIVLDVRMPVMDAFEFDARRRKRPALALVPVIVLTASREDERIEKEIRADAYLRKPTEPDTIVRTLHEVLENRRVARRAGMSRRFR